MIYIATSKDNKDALMHYGVPGMRWRNRRGPQPLAPGTPTLSLPQRTRRIDPRLSASTRHRTIFPTGHARVQVGDQPKTYTPKPPIPQRNTAKKTLERGTSGNSNRWRSDLDMDAAWARGRGNGLMSRQEYMRRHRNGESYSDMHANEGFKNRPSNSSKQVSSSRVRDLRRRRYGR